MPTVVPLIEALRGETRENTYFGSIAVSHSSGKIGAAVGDARQPVFTRSTLKALQALSLVKADHAARLLLAQPQFALLCASHNGEPMHVEQCQSILDKAGVTYKRLQCGCHVPYYVQEGLGPAPEHIDERMHNCSGKHAGMLAHCVASGWPLDDYLDPMHPLQVSIRSHVARACRIDESQMKMGIDGCSAPNYAMPLSALATGYARLATGIKDTEFGESFEQLATAMTTYPELVSGTGRNDLAFMRAGRGDWVTKIGAEGVQAFASRSRGQAFAIKISDGNKQALYAATIEVLDQLGWMDAKQREALEPWRMRDILSVKGAKVGERRAVFKLERA